MADARAPRPTSVWAVCQPSALHGVSLRAVRQGRQMPENRDKEDQSAATTPRDEGGLQDDAGLAARDGGLQMMQA